MTAVAIGTASGRCLYVDRQPYHVGLSDHASAHAGWTLLTSQARELGSALIAAADSVEGDRLQPVTEQLSE
jgi:hypothetical protein